MSVEIVDDSGRQYELGNNEFYGETAFEFPRETTGDEALAYALQQQMDEEEDDLHHQNIQKLAAKSYTGAQLGIKSSTKPKFIYFMMITLTLFMIIEILVNNSRDGEYIENPQENPLIGPSDDTLIFMGAKRTDLIVDEGDWWRLFTPVLLHAGLIHLAFNMIFLYSFGAGLEREFGHPRVAYIFLLSGVVGILFSALFNPTETTVGASGAAYGLIGAAWAEFFLNFAFYKKTSWKSWLCQLLFGTALNLILGLIPTLDNFAHIGGFITGVLAGLQVLTLPRYDYFLEVKPEQWYQVFLKAFAYFMTPLSLIILISVLYTGVDVNRYCPNCKYLNCYPTPLWLCDVDCTEPFEINPQPNGDVEVTCPRDLGIVFVPGPIDDLSGDNDAQVAFCEEHCLST